MSKRFTCLRLNVYPVMLVAALLCVALAGCSATPVTQTAPGDLGKMFYIRYLHLIILLTMVDLRPLDLDL
jgi:hypothetical protein